MSVQGFLNTRRSAGVFLAVLLGVSLTAASVALAQVNTEQLRSDGKEKGFSGKLGLDITLKRGNVDFLAIGTGVRIDFTDSVRTVFLVGNLDLSSESGNTFEQSGFYHIRFNQPLTTRVIGEAFVQQEYSKSRRLDNRMLGGAGFRFRLYKGTGFFINAGTTWMFEYEKLIRSDNLSEDPITRHHRWSNYVVFKATLENRVDFLNTVYAQPRFDAFRDVRILNETRLAFRIFENLVIENSFRLRYDSQPPAGITRTDLSLKTGLSFLF